MAATTNKRVFANTVDRNYIDYIKNKKGIEIIKNSQSKKKTQISSFRNYDEFLIITKTYYKYLHSTYYSLQVPTNLYCANTSFITYEDYIIHKENCSLCKHNSHKVGICKQLMNILYPYGESVVDSTNSNNIYLHSRFDTSIWCKKCENRTEDSNRFLVDNPMLDNIQKNTIKKGCGNHGGLCKKTTPLFI